MVVVFYFSKQILGGWTLEKEKIKNNAGKKIINSVCIAICVFLSLIIIVNVTMIVKSYADPDQVPSFFGYKPFIVLSGSMEPTILTGDVVLIKEASVGDVAEEDIITFRVGDNTDTIITHRVTEVLEEEGVVTFLTKGDANTGADAGVVSAEDLEGKYIARVGGLGSFAMFLQTPVGMLIFVVTPLMMFIVYDIINRNLRSRKRNSRESELEAELEKLRANQKIDN